MESFLRATLVLLPVAYLLTAIDYGALFFLRYPGAQRSAPWLLRGTLLLHFSHLVVATLRWHQFPAATVPQALSVIAFAVAVVYGLVEWQGKERSTGVWTLALVFLLQLLSSLLSRPQPPQPQELFSSPLFTVHVGLAVLGYAAFVISGVYGFLFLELYRELKSAHFRVFYGRLPPLEVLERMLAGSLGVGFVALTGAVVAGVFWAYTIDYSTWLRDTKILFTLATWLLYGGALLMRRLRRWQGRQTAVASLAGLIAILVSLMTVNFFVTGGFHGF